MSDSDSLGPLFAGVNIALVIVAVISVALRCYVRIGIINAFGQDDYWMVMAMASYIANTTVALLSVRYGAGQHIWNLSAQDIVQAKKYTYASEITYGLTMILSKISIAWFLLRITPNRVHRRIIYLASGLTCVAGLTLVFIVMFQCQPLSLAWDTNQPGSCLPVEVIIVITYCYSSFAIFTDFTLTLLPLYLIWKLQMDTRTKVALVPVMCLALVASLAVVLRLPHVNDFKKEDFFYAIISFSIWSAVEQGLAITAGSLATLRPFLRKVFGQFKVLNAPPRHPFHGQRNSKVNGNVFMGDDDYNGQTSHKGATRIFGPSTFNFTRMDDNKEDEYQLYLGNSYPLINGISPRS